MKILIIAEYLGNIKEPESQNNRFFYIADSLAAKGHTVRIVTTDFIHNLKTHVFDVNEYKTCELIALHEPGYPKNICFKRFRSHRVLSQNLKSWLESIEKPDVIYCAIPSIDFAYEAARYAEKENVRFIVDIQDLWPEAFEMIIRIPILSKVVFTPFRIRANYVYGAANSLIAVSETYGKRAMQVNKKSRKCTTVYLGTDLALFDKYKFESVAIKKEEGDIWLGYVGTIGYSYDLKTVMDSMVLLKSKTYYEKIKFIVIGDGPLRQKFEAHACRKKLNVLFIGRLPYQQMVATLCKCDIAINPIKRNSAGSIINKHADYAASGIPVVNSQECEEYRNLVLKWNMGINCFCEDAESMAKQLAYLIENEQVRHIMGKHARECAEKCFDRSNNYCKIVNIIEKK